MYCLCVNVYCTTATGWQPKCSYIYHIIYAKLAKASYFIYLFKVRTILDPMCCCVRSGDTLSYYTLHGAVASEIADTQSARR
jgi:hypothetical protein